MPDNLDENALNIYTDGSSYSNPRKGGLGFLFVTVDDDGADEVHEYTPIGYKGANNQQMELRACVEALVVVNGKYPPVDPARYTKIVIRTDSRYVVDNFNNAKFSWPANKWNTRDGRPVLNAETWKDLIKEVKKVGKRIEIVWVKGHKTSEYNKAVDKLAKQSAKTATSRRLSIVTVRRKKSANQVSIGSVKPSGQRLTIRIVTDEYLKVQRCFKYKYEVMSKASAFYGCVDIVFSEHLMKAGHTYYVRFNSTVTNPRVTKVYREFS